MTTIPQLERCEVIPCASSLDIPLVSVTDQRTPWQQITDVALACLKQVSFFLSTAAYYVRFFFQRKTLFLPVRQQEQQWTYSQENFPWKESSQSDGLCVFVSGLFGHPSIWGGYIKELKKKHPQLHIIAPRIPKLGNCSLETAANPLLPLLRDYMEKFPGRPLSLIGTSNGSRIISYVENQLTPEEMNGRQLNVVSLSGLHYGTQIVTGNKIKLFFLSKILHPAVLNEFPWKSLTAQTLSYRWAKKQEEWQKRGIDVHHFFCASRNDEAIRPYSSMLPLLSGTCNYRIVSGENHHSVVSRVKPEVLQWLCQA